MPFSQSSQLSTILVYIEETQPKSILDVGTGMGQYGFLARTNLENINLFEVNGKQAKQKLKSEWSIQIDGVEGCEIYHTPVHDYVYNNMFWGDALEILLALSKEYDLVLAIDILEHFHQEDGIRFIELLKQLSKKAVLVSTPKDFIEQQVEANPYENHRSVWGKKDLEKCDFNQFYENQFSWISVYNQ